jgi:hypothetical protein
VEKEKVYSLESQFQWSAAVGKYLQLIYADRYSCAIRGCSHSKPRTIRDLKRKTWPDCILTKTPWEPFACLCF